MVTIRLATVDDARGLAEVRVRGWQVGYAGFVDADFLAAMSVDENEVRWREIVDGHDEHVRVAVVDDRVVGFATTGPYRIGLINEGLEAIDTIGELYGFYVHPDSWGTGVADELHAAALSALRDADWQTLKLWVLEENHRARRFYERHGWTADGGRQQLDFAGNPMEVRYERLAAT